mgnify:CR=1 FL=1
MTNTTTAPRDFVKGQTVTFARNARGTSASGYGSAHPFSAGDTAEVTRVNRHTITVKTAVTVYGQRGMYSFNVPRDSLEAPNGETFVPIDKPKPRKLGVTPEGNHIAIDDPRIAWIWKDAAKLASNTGYCSQYDSLTDKLGIPGRERDFRVNATVAGMQVTAVVKATSQKLADQIFKEKLASTK